MNKEQIRKLQNFIKENGLENDDLVKRIMRLDIDKIKRQKDYWNSLKGKYFKNNYNNHFELLHVVDVREFIDTSLKVTVNRYDVRAYDTAINVLVEENHWLSDNYENRYSDFIEISKEEYMTHLAKINKLIENGNCVLNELLGNDK